MDDCLFCKIIKGDIPSTTIFQDEQVTAFRDINPAAPVHILLVPNKHIADVNDIAEEDEKLIGHLIRMAQPIAEQEGIAKSGYRLIINTGPDSHQEIFHLHLHILGGHPMKHPMG
ncbi:MAG: histidine triad nucleotide-binding protein [Anaerolineales bacterium]